LIQTDNILLAGGGGVSRGDGFCGECVVWFCVLLCGGHGGYGGGFFFCGGGDGGSPRTARGILL
jgi:hypothetical protein